MRTSNEHQRAPDVMSAIALAWFILWGSHAFGTQAAWTDPQNGTDARTFAELSEAVLRADHSSTAVVLTVPQITCTSQIDVCGGDVSIYSDIGTILIGGDENRIFRLTNKGSLYLHGVSMTAGRSTGNGGAILVVAGSSLTMWSVEISSSTAFNGGAISAVQDSRVSMAHSTFLSNSANSFGGAVHAVSGAAMNAGNSRFGANQASAGGALYARDAATIHTTACTMSSNLALSDGGAIHAQDTETLTIINCRISFNSASFAGGAIWAISTPVVLDTASLDWNTANHAGALYVQSTVLNANHCTCNSNVAHSLGGTLFADSNSTSFLADTRMSFNSANSGGAMMAYGGARLTMISCSMNDNVAITTGGAMYAVWHTSVWLFESVLQSNSAQNGGAVMISGSSKLSIAGSVVKSNSATGGDGGALLVISFCSLNITNCVIEANSADGAGGGGAIALSQSFARLAFCRLIRNTAGVQGAVVSVSDYAMFRATDCWMATNSAVRGGVVSATGACMVNFTSCQFASNTASISGGAISGSKRGIVTASDCTFDSNSAMGGGAIRAGKNEMLLSCVLCRKE